MKLELNTSYQMNNGDIITFDSVSNYSNFKGIPIDIYTSNEYHGHWNSKGRYMSSIYFDDKKQSEMDIKLNGKQ